MSDITIVTAFFDIGRGNLPKEKHGRVLPHYQHRDVETYLQYFGKQAEMQNDMIVYTSEDLAPKIYEMRKQHGLQDKTKIVVMPSYLPDELKEYKPKVEQILNSPEFFSRVANPHLLEYWNAYYDLVTNMKSFYVSHAINAELIDTELVAWIDFGYCREASSVPSCKKWSYDFDPDKIHFWNLIPIEPERPIDSIIYTGDVYIMGCHIVAGKEKWKYLNSLVIGCLNKLIEHNLIDDDQGLWLMAYLTNPDAFELHQGNPNDWFNVFKTMNSCLQ